MAPTLALVSGDLAPVQAAAGDAVSEVRTRLAAALEVPIASIDLLADGTPLRNEQILSECNIDTVTVVLRSVDRHARLEELQSADHPKHSYCGSATADAGHGDATWEVANRWALRQSAVREHVSDSSNPSMADGSIYSVFDLDMPLGSKIEPLHTWRCYITRSRGGSSGTGYGTVELNGDEAIVKMRGQPPTSFDLLAAAEELSSKAGSRCNF